MSVFEGSKICKRIPTGMSVEYARFCLKNPQLVRIDEAIRARKTIDIVGFTKSRIEKEEESKPKHGNRGSRKTYSETFGRLLSIETERKMHKMLARFPEPVSFEEFAAFQKPYFGSRKAVIRYDWMQYAWTNKNKSQYP